MCKEKRRFKLRTCESGGVLSSQAARAHQCFYGSSKILSADAVQNEIDAEVGVKQLQTAVLDLREEGDVYVSNHLQLF